MSDDRVREIEDAVGEYWLWFDVYLRQGFTAEQAIALLTRPIVTVNVTIPSEVEVKR